MRILRKIARRREQVAALKAQFGDLIARERRLLFLGALALAGEIGAQLLVPIPLKYIFDGLITPRPEAWLPFVPEGFAENATEPQRVWFLVIVCSAVLMISALLGLFGYLRTVWTATAGQRMVMRLRKRLYSHLHRLSLRFHHGNRLGDLIVRITGDIPMLRDVLSGALIDLVGRLVLVVVMLAILLYLDLQLALASVAVLVGVGLLSLAFSRRIVRVAKKQREQEGILAYTAGETLSSLALVKALGREDEVVRRFARGNRTSMRKGLKATRLQASLSRWVELTLAAGLAVVLLFGVLRVLDGEMTPGTLLVFLSYVKNLNKPLRRASRIAGKIGKAAACGERITEVLRIEPEEVDAPDAIAAPTLRGEIEFRDVSFTYGESIDLSSRALVDHDEDEDDEDGEEEEDLNAPVIPEEEALGVDLFGDDQPDAGFSSVPETPRVESHSKAPDSITPRRRALDHVSLTIAPGERVALVGRNGAGKSTLLHLLLRFYEPTEGELLLDGTPANAYTIRSLRDQIGIALQGTYLFGSTIEENLRFAAPEATAEEIDAAISHVGAEFIHDLPEGLDTELSEGGHNLSGGQRRKLVVTGALLRKAAILVLDEPTSSIDPASRDDLLAALPSAIAGRTTILITHDPVLLTAVDRVVYLEDGQLLATGTHSELRTASESYSALFPEPDEEGAFR